MRISKKITKTVLKAFSIVAIMAVALSLGKTEVKAEEGDRYLTFTALGEGENAIRLEALNHEGDYEYRINEGDWSPNNSWDGNRFVNLVLSKGDRVSFRATESGKGKKANAYITMDSGIFKASGDVTSLTNGVGGDCPLPEGCYEKLFHNSEIGNGALINAPNLPSTTLSRNCYKEMFLNCRSLKSAPELPAITIAEGCYESMFKGCTNLENAPELPATTLAENCYKSMFQGCTKLKNAPELPATTAPKNCYGDMFNGCESIESAPELPATTIAEGCYERMFKGCINLAVATESLPATTVFDSCYANMFDGCGKLKRAPEILPARTLAQNCYSSMFDGCAKLENVPELPATTLAEYCYLNMFDGCKSIESAPELPATTLKTGCYSRMFSGCTNLNNGPTILPAVTLEEDCYSSMFERCSSLVKTPELKGKILADKCYYAMFKGCESLRKAYDLLDLDMSHVSIEEPGNGVCGEMFYGCTALITAPRITANTLKKHCFEGMFSGCTSLSYVPMIKAETLAEYCFYSMFWHCTNLQYIPSFSFTNLPAGCFESMFEGCTSLEISTEIPDGSYVEWKLEANRPVVEGALAYMFYDATIDACKITPEINKTYYIKVRRFNITIEKSENGTVTVENTTAIEGEPVKLNVRPNSGYELDRWEVSDGVEIFDDNTFSMPATDVTIKAIFKKSAGVKSEVKSKTTPAVVKSEVKSKTTPAVEDTFKSEFPAGTVLTMEIDNYRLTSDMKVHSISKRDETNQAINANYYASLMKKKAKILFTYGVYSRSEIPSLELGTKKVLAWNKVSIKTPGTIYAACYNQKDGAYLLSGNINENGTAVFFGFRSNGATNVTLFTME